tara:strand:- start:1836 stop:2627 length:792 start_codon:yes stop_codon:yes gene_type:complete
MKDTLVIDSAFLKFKDYIKNYKLDKLSTYIIFPIIIVIFFNIIDYFLYHYIHSFFSFLLGLVSLLYCLKPNEYNQKLENLKFSIENNIDLDESERFNYILFVEKNTGPTSIINNAFYNSVRTIFSVLFVFLLLGPSGCLAYVILDNYLYSEKIKIDQKSKKFIKLILSFIEYLPVRITAFTFAVVANFQLCLNEWKSIKDHKEFYNSNINLINSIGAASFEESNNVNEDAIIQMIAYTQLMVSRSLLAWLSLIAFLIIGGFFI